MREEELTPSYLERPYTGFLFKAVTSIYEKWVEGYTEAALAELLKLVVALPTDVKDQLWDEKEKIEKDLRQAYKLRSVDWYSTQQFRNRRGKEVATYYMEPFFDKTVRLLDQKKWLERGALRPRAKGHGKLSI